MKTREQKHLDPTCSWRMVCWTSAPGIPLLLHMDHWHQTRKN